MDPSGVVTSGWNVKNYTGYCYRGTVIMDSMGSNVKEEASSRVYRLIHPRVADAAHDIWRPLDVAGQEEHLRMLGLDAQGAFWNIPLRHCERTFYCGLIRGSPKSSRKAARRIRYLCYTRTAPGSRSAPLSWAVTSASSRGVPELPQGDQGSR